MSFPAMLGVPGVVKQVKLVGNDILDAELSAIRLRRSNRREDKEGKRWIRRKENARFVDNPHIVQATKKDFAVPTPNTRTTFPQPLPVYLSRNNPIPAATPAVREPLSASAGRFSMGLKGMRKQLRKSGPRAELLVREVEAEITEWLANSIWLDPDTSAAAQTLVPIGTSTAIMEVSRTPMQLVWAIEDDAFARYVVHCCSRYHNIVSFSKDVTGQRLTYILRPHITRPAYEAPQGLDTPPGTDLESSVVDSESDIMTSDLDSQISDIEIDSDAELGHRLPPPRPHHLANIPESSPNSPVLRASTDTSTLDDSWSVVNESDADADIEHDLVQSVASLDLDADTTPRAARQLRQGPLRSHLWDRQRRAASSPSRSPARHGRNPPRSRRLVVSTKIDTVHPASFYDYLFA
ncbi:hypothetical protein BDY19DRAFT_987182 [Irpex rosettiformis]|uniref:Uncharacterized protein n=1 Tax=Irpex rosettiformis TaxID=378272 RepID=A0ACB8TT04_9APHY|nr:hypothetical protein BDY19DRAFT_987182 [Irpex rosettiformis]